ncbi:MAG: SdiA-regulated domain-containing protein [Campylobacterota bacterium]|nr:SdiA-regulated domain-containing protein [Campylobacterota bacterium]
MSTINAKVIAKIPEASGICYIQNLKQLIVINDEGWIYRVTKKGKILEKKFLGDYDLEGIDYNEISKKLYLAVEGKNYILVLDINSFKILEKIKIKKQYKKSGLEAIAIKDSEIYLSNQNNSVLFKLGKIKNNKAKIIKTYNHGYIDIAGLTFYNNYLYMTSDKKDLLIKYDIKTNKTIKKIKLPKSAQEGICFDENNNLYIADDNGRVLKYKAKKLGI